MRMVRTSFDRMDMRRERRYLSPVFEVTVAGRRFRSINWSMSGLLLDGRCRGAAIGAVVDGALAVPGSTQTLSFSAELVRQDPETGASALRFEDIGPAGVDFLDRAVAHRLH
ncbi:MAG: PilZ domain-containing protein [Alphaproteobacteria bacterium]|nr:PilZ domain-containing protein [Alphaproteobacteria bacterium]